MQVKKGKVFTVILMGIVMTTGGKMTEFNTEVKADISQNLKFIKQMRQEELVQACPILDMIQKMQRLEMAQK